jgi:cytokinin dehydrogenase
MWTEERLRELATEARVNVRCDEASLKAAAEDYGHLVTGRPRGVAHPTVADEAARVVGFAHAHALPVTLRGTGHGQSGQSVAVDSLVLDLSALRRIDRPDVDQRRVTCDAGVTWREVITAVGPAKLVPPATPILLDLSIGGTLSAGGVGPGSAKHGTCAANVIELEVLTGEGRRVWCSPTDQSALFNAALGGVGRMGAILRVTLALRPVKPAVRTFYLLFDTIDAWQMAQRRFIAGRAYEYLDAFCSASIQGLRKTPSGRRLFAVWSYALHVSFEHEGTVPTAARALDGVRGHRVVQVEDDPSSDFLARYDARFDMMRRLGAFDQPHPIFECFLPRRVLPELLPRVLDELPLSLGDGHRMNPIAARNLPRFLMTPDEDFACFAVLPAAIPRPLVDEVLLALASVHEMCLKAGGKRYLSGWLGMMDADGWRAHFGREYDAWVAAKRTYDPKGIFRSMLFPE